MAGQHEDVIDWDEAMQQVGEDDDFLRELLNDLRGELESQVAAIAAIIQNPPEHPYEQIRRAAHRVKGAASNLMCGQLHSASRQLEQAAATAHAANPPTAEMTANVHAGYTALQQAGTNFIAFLQTIGV